MDANKIKIDKDKCIGCSSCCIIASGTFKIGDDGKAEVIDPPGDSDDVICNAAESCPMQGIEIVE